MAEVIALQPKRRDGFGRNYKWVIAYDPQRKLFHWELHFTTSHVLRGDASSEAEALATVKEHIKRIKQ